MNIFQVLSEGKSRLHEPSISAMLGYLLDSRKDHGLGDTFSRSFIELINDRVDSEVLRNALNKDFIHTEVDLEQPYQLRESRKDIDIQVRFLNDDKTEYLRLIIENKIKVSAANPKQLNEYYEAVNASDEEIANLGIIFVTPESDNTLLEAEYNALQRLESGHFKDWIYWNGERSILNALRSVLAKEHEATIRPITEYMRHTLKAFILHVDRITALRKGRQYRFGEDIGDIVDEIQVNLEDSIYTIIRRTSHQIQIYKDGDKVVAKPILKKIIKHFKLPITTTSRVTGQGGLNTREMGRKVIEEIKSSNHANAVDPHSASLHSGD
jgi:hypothetical protein